MADSFDVIVIGAGPAGETVASRVCAKGVSTALIERELLGGECAYWACMPSKTLLRAAEVPREAERTAGTSRPAQRWQEVVAYRDEMVRNLDDSDEAESYAKQGVRVFRGQGTIAGPGHVKVGDQTLHGERIVIATGSGPNVPEIEGLEQAGYWTSRDVTSMREVPSSVCVLGGGPVGIELGQLLARFGARVHIIEQSERLLAREAPRVGELILEALKQDGIEVHLGAEASSVSAGGVRVGDTEIECERVVVAASRKPRTAGLGLENVGIKPSARGIEVDERCLAAERIYAIGDVTGKLPLSHVAMYQGRIVVADILGATARADYTAIARTVFCDPEAAAVGLTEAQAREQGIDCAAVTVKLPDKIARPWTYETEPRGELSVIADRQRKVLIGAWAVAPMAGEWIHYAALAIKAEIPIAVLTDTVAQFPTYTEAYEKALSELEL
jgi:pyruvate/2-oxoglutarate dehydrogenase complex dihydrolipoamide dehydrogenase (E3) component